MMDNAIAVSVINLIGTLVGTFSGIMASTKLVEYRLKQLERQVEKHNNVVERQAVVEREQKQMWFEINEVKSDIKDLRKEEG